MVEDTRKVQNEKVVMLRAGSGEAVNPRRVAGAKIVMTSGVMPNMQTKTTTVTPSRNTSAGQDGTTQPVDINPDSGYTAMTKVTVSTPQLHQYQKMEVSYVSDSGGTEYEGDTPGTTAEKTLVVAPTKDGMAYEGAAYRIHPDSAMGDAQPADVLSGKTFTSASGIAQVGTGSGTGNLQVKTTTVTPAITMNASATTTQSVEISPDTGYDGMSKVNVSTPQQHINGLVNVNGVSYGGSVWNGDTEETYNDKMLIVTPSKNGMAYTRASNGLLLVKPSASMGNATAADVRQGKTFTSGSGIAQTGNMTGGDDLVKTRYTVSASSWSASANASGYYTYSLTLNPTLSTSYAPNIYISGSGDSVLHTAREESMFELLKYIDLTASNTLVLYSTKKPDTTFYIFVEGQAA